MIRRRKPDKRRAQLVASPERASTAWRTLEAIANPVLLLDTTVYIHSASGRLPAELESVMDRALLFHCSVTLGELTVGFAGSDPKRPRWSVSRDHYRELFAAMPESRLLNPDPGIWIDAGLIAGMLSRLQGFQDHQRKAAMNDALIFLTAAKAGLPVLTANRDEFDLIQQLAPEGRYVHYRPA